MDRMMNVRGVLSVVLVVSMAGCTASRTGPPTSPPSSDVSVSSTPSSVPSVLVASPTTCPPDLAKRVHANHVPGTSAAIVPGDPVLLVLCTPSARVELRDPSQVRRITEALNDLKRVPPGAVFFCPADFGPTYGLFFDYASGDVLLVTADASGCRFASNGRSSARLTPALLARIAALVPGIG